MGLNFELRIAGDDSDDLAVILARLAAAFPRATPSGVIWTATSLTPETEAALTGTGTQAAPNGDDGSSGLPLTQEAFAKAAEASQGPTPASPPPAEATAPKPRGRPRKEASAGTPGTEAPRTTEKLEKLAQEAQAEVQAEDPEIPDHFRQQPKDDGPLTPGEMRERAIGLLQSIFGKPSGPVEVRTLQTRFKIKKFNEVPDEMCEALLGAARDLHARVMAVN